MSDSDWMEFNKILANKKLVLEKAVEVANQMDNSSDIQKLSIETHKPRPPIER